MTYSKSHQLFYTCSFFFLNNHCKQNRHANFHLYIAHIRILCTSLFYSRKSKKIKDLYSHMVELFAFKGSVYLQHFQYTHIYYICKTFKFFFMYLIASYMPLVVDTISLLSPFFFFFFVAFPFSLFHTSHSIYAITK